MLPLIAIAVGVGLGYATGGAVRSIPAPSVPQVAGLAVLYTAQAAIRGLLSGSHAVWWVWSVIGIVLAVLLWLVPAITGARLASAGVAMNVLVVLLNGGMPVVTASAVVGAGAARPFYLLDPKSAVATALADVLPLRLLGQTTMLSVGDILLAIGVCAYVVLGMRREEWNSQEESA